MRSWVLWEVQSRRVAEMRFEHEVQNMDNRKNTGKTGNNKYVVEKILHCMFHRFMYFQITY